MKAVFQTIMSFILRANLKTKLKKKAPLRNLRASLEVEMEITSGRHTFTTVTHDIAIGGVSFDAPMELQQGDRVKVALLIPTKKGIKRVKADGKIVWVRPGDSCWTMGVAFSEFEKGGRGIVRGCLMAYVQDDKGVSFKGGH